MSDINYKNLIARLRGETREITLPTSLDMEAADAIEDLLKGRPGVSGINCPKCGCEHEEDGMESAGEWDCQECGFQFVVEVDREPIYSVWCKEHEWGAWKDTKLALWRYRQCKRCDKLESRRDDERRD